MISIITANKIYYTEVQNHTGLILRWNFLHR